MKKIRTSHPRFSSPSTPGRTGPRGIRYFVKLTPVEKPPRFIEKFGKRWEFYAPVIDDYLENLERARRIRAEGYFLPMILELFFTDDPKHAYYATYIRRNPRKVRS